MVCRGAARAAVACATTTFSASTTSSYLAPPAAASGMPARRGARAARARARRRLADGHIAAVVPVVRDPLPRRRARARAASTPRASRWSIACSRRRGARRAVGPLGASTSTSAVRAKCDVRAATHGAGGASGCRRARGGGVRRRARRRRRGALARLLGGQAARPTTSSPCRSAASASRPAATSAGRCARRRRRRTRGERRRARLRWNSSRQLPPRQRDLRHPTGTTTSTPSSTPAAAAAWRTPMGPPSRRSAAPAGDVGMVCRALLPGCASSAECPCYTTTPATALCDLAGGPANVRSRASSPVSTTT